MTERLAVSSPELWPQASYRSVLGAIAICALATRGWLDGAMLPFLWALLILVYVIAASALMWVLSATETPSTLTQNGLARADAVLAGSLIAGSGFALLPSALVIAVTLYHSIANGGWQRGIWDGVAVTVGVLLVAVFEPPAARMDPGLWVDAVAATACTLHFASAGYRTFARVQAQRVHIGQLEQQQVALKLDNYCLSKYLSPTLRDAIHSGRLVKLESRRAPLTVFFSDIKGFSELAEEMDADALTTLLGNYLTEMSAIALRHGATIDKFIGDAIMVFFGDPTTKGVREDAVACVAMAIEMKKRMKELQLRWRNQGVLKPLQIRMGINTGYCTVGNFGTENRLDFTAIGTEVNLASRLEAAAEADEVLLTHASYMLVKDAIACRPRGTVIAKGFQQPIPVYTAIDLRRNLGGEQRYLEYETEGFAVYLDLDKVRNYDRERVVRAIESVHRSLRDQPVELGS